MSGATEPVASAKPRDASMQLDDALARLGDRLTGIDAAEAEAAVRAVAEPLEALAALEPQLLALIADGEKIQATLSRLVVPRTYVYLIAGTILITGSAAVIMGNPSLQLWYFVGVALLFVVFVAVYLKQAAKFSRLSRPTQDSLARATVEMATLVQAIDAEEAKLADADFDFSTDTFAPFAPAIDALSATDASPADRVMKARASLKKTPSA